MWVTFPSCWGQAALNTSAPGYPRVSRIRIAVHSERIRVTKVTSLPDFKGQCLFMKIFIGHIQLVGIDLLGWMKCSLHSDADWKSQIWVSSQLWGFGWADSWDEVVLLENWVSILVVNVVTKVRDSDRPEEPAFWALEILEDIISSTPSHHNERPFGQVSSVERMIRPVRVEVEPREWLNGPPLREKISPKDNNITNKHAPTFRPKGDDGAWIEKTLAKRDSSAVEGKCLWDCVRW